jgi:hypothetical protein
MSDQFSSTYGTRTTYPIFLITPLISSFYLLLFSFNFFFFLNPKIVAYESIFFSSSRE